MNRVLQNLCYLAKFNVGIMGSLIFLEPKHGCGSPPRCRILFIDWVGQGTLYSLDLPQTDKNLRAARADPNSFEVCRVAREIQQMLNLGYPWIFGKLVVSLQP